MITHKDSQGLYKFNLPYKTIRNISELKLENSKIDKFKFPEEIEAIEMRNNGLRII